MRGACLACGRCSYCGLPVLTDEDAGHPGHGVVEQLPPGRGLPGDGAAWSAGLRLVHRLCARALASRTHRRALLCGVAVRRARLWRATERYESGTAVPCRHDSLGLATRGRAMTTWSTTWRIRKMRYAALAARRYFTAGAEDHYRRVR